MSMICDWVTLTTPESVSDSVLTDVQKVLHAVGAIAVTDELWQLANNNGSFTHKKRRNFSVFSASGQMLDELRTKDLYSDFFSPFVGTPHSVTRLDIAHDRLVDAPRALRHIYSKARSGKIALTRKKLRLSQVRRLMSPRADGIESGTVYLGRPTAEVRARIYDKRLEILDKTGFDIGHDRTRYELTLTSKTGIGLSDVFSPEAAFWHHMGDVLKRPANAPVWEKTGEGFSLSKPKDYLPTELLKRKIEFSPEVDKLLLLAQDCGPHGVDMLCRLLKEKSLRLSSTEDSLGSLAS